MVLGRVSEDRLIAAVPSEQGDLHSGDGSGLGYGSVHAVRAQSLHGGDQPIEVGVREGRYPPRAKVPPTAMLPSG